MVTMGNTILDGGRVSLRGTWGREEKWRNWQIFTRAARLASERASERSLLRKRASERASESPAKRGVKPCSTPASTPPSFFGGEGGVRAGS